MKITVTREECKHQYELLEELRRWELLQRASGEHNRGEFTLKMDSTPHGKSNVSLSIDRYGLSHHKVSSPVERCHQEIGYIVANAMSDLTRDVCEAIKRHLPFEME